MRASIACAMYVPMYLYLNLDFCVYGVAAGHHGFQRATVLVAVNAAPQTRWRRLLAASGIDGDSAQWRSQALA